MGIRYDIIYAVKELSRVLQEPTQIAHEILARTLTYVTQTHRAHPIFDHEAMTSYTLPPTKKKPNQQADMYNVDGYNTTDPVPHHDDDERIQEYIYKGHQCIVICYTDIDLAGQHETRQSASGYLLFINGVLVHYHGRTERQIITSPCAGEYIALSRGHAVCRFITTILQFYANKESICYLFTDNQAAEHLATQPNLNEHGRIIDTRHHEVRQDYLEGKVQIGGVKTTANSLAHQEHSKFLNLTPPKPYTQNGNFIRTNDYTKLNSPKRSGQRRSPDCVKSTSARARIESDGNCSRHIPTQKKDNDKNSVKDFGTQYTHFNRTIPISQSIPNKHSPPL